MEETDENGKPLTYWGGKQKPDEVVKDLNYFLNEVAIEEGFEKYDLKEFNSESWTGFTIRLEATERWYKHQLETQGLEIIKNYKSTIISENIALKVIIEEQKKEIEVLQNTLLMYTEIKRKLTQENEALKQK